MYINLKNSDFDLNNIKEVSNKKEDKITFNTKEFIPITSDCMFKVIFGREENIKFPCYLLSYLIDMSYEELLDKLKFTKNETGKEKKSDSTYRNDLVLDIDGVIINVEMNNNNTEEIRNRNISYLMRLREDRKNKLEYHQVIQVNLNNYCYKEDTCVRRDFLLSSKDDVILTNKIVIIDIYLPNIKKKMYNKGIEKLSEMERFLLIGLEENKKKALEYVGDNIVMKDLEDRISDWTLSDDLRESYDKEWALKDQALRDGYLDGFNEGKQDGREEGIKEGIKEGIREGKKQNKIEIIKNMLNNGLSKEEISKYTNMTLEEINSII